eukprot:8444618-Pyramimonas_sp.AAC.2
MASCSRAHHQKPPKPAAKTAGDLFLGECDVEMSDVRGGVGFTKRRFPFTDGRRMYTGSTNEALSEENVIMTYQLVNEICRSTGGYTLPRINTNLYLHGRRFKKIQCLDKYTGLKVPAPLPLRHSHQRFPIV